MNIVDTFRQHVRPNKLNCMFYRMERFLTTSESLITSSTVIEQDRDEIFTLLHQVKNGSLSIEQAVSQLSKVNAATSNHDIPSLSSFANIDHNRYHRTRFPEVVFAQSKTSQQVASILDDMAGNLIQRCNNSTILKRQYIPPILATR
jgi:hypothetical protein